MIGVAIADVTIWELAFLFSRGVLRTHGTVENTVHNFVARSGVSVKPITAEIAALATQFPEDLPLRTPLIGLSVPPPGRRVLRSSPVMKRYEAVR